MDLYEVLSRKACTEKTFISITGGGGKTTLMTEFASYLRSSGKRVLMTTSTKIMSPYLHDYKADWIFSDDSVLSFAPECPCSVIYALEDKETGKWRCPPVEIFDVLIKRYDAIICESDGSRRLPFKIHTQRDPVILPFTTYTVSVMGLWGVGHEAREVAFGDDRNVVVERSYLNWYLNDPEGLLKGSLKGSRAIVFNGTEDFKDTGMLRGLDYPQDVYVCTANAREGILYEELN